MKEVVNNEKTFSQIRNIFLNTCKYAWFVIFCFAEKFRVHSPEHMKASKPGGPIIQSQPS